MKPYTYTLYIRNLFSLWLWGYLYFLISIGTTHVLTRDYVATFCSRRRHILLIVGAVRPVAAHVGRAQQVHPERSAARVWARADTCHRLVTAVSADLSDTDLSVLCYLWWISSIIPLSGQSPGPGPGVSPSARPRGWSRNSPTSAGLWIRAQLMHCWNLASLLHLMSASWVPASPWNLYHRI